MPRAPRSRYIAAVILDGHNLAEIARHHVSEDEVEQLLFNRKLTMPNPRGPDGSMLLIGETDGGRILTVALSPVDDAGTWRPATSFDATRHQKTFFQRYAR